MRVVVIGATGHIGGYLVPRLVESGHEVIALSRGLREPYRAHPAWRRVTAISVDRDEEEARGTFGARIASLDADAVVDLICFTPDSARHLIDGLRGSGTFLAHCGTIWVHGPAVEVPVTEELPRRPFGDYGVNKAAIEALILREARRGELRATVLHPGHIVGPGWVPLNPAGHFEPAVFERLARGERLALANFGLETVHHVHADDVAQAFGLALDRQGAANGEAFHVVSERAITLRGYAEAVAAWFGKEADLDYQSFEEWRKGVDAASAQAAFDHLAHSPSISTEKARSLLGYRPRYRSLEAVAEALGWLITHGKVDSGGAMPAL
ncbi:MAG: NAD-dependent epimerase/dehydratase family protein [Actinomycetota bacterium]|nr:NAD-dependent epimerase/dehydratase family protein [Actinomycetota bacterium]